MSTTIKIAKISILTLSFLAWMTIFSVVILKNIELLALRPEAATTDVDISTFWSAAVFAWNGAHLAAFDLDAMRALQANASTGGAFVYPWLYPPAVMLILMPLGALSFINAWIALVIGSLLVLRAALRKFSHPYETLSFLVLFSPATLYCGLRGQLTMLLAAALLMGFANLIRGRELRSAAWMSLVTLKPQICLVLPVALAVSRSWSLMAFGLAFILVLSVVPLLILGLGYWAEWLNALEAQAAWLESVKAQQDGFFTPEAFSMYSMTWEAFFVNLGLEQLAGRLQWVFGLLMLSAMTAVWAAKGSSPELRASALLFSMIGASPYAWSYEVLFPLLGALVLVQVTWTARGRPRYGCWMAGMSAALFLAVWFGPLVRLGEQPISVAMMPLCLAGLTLALILSRTSACADGESARQP
ncbi:DUF2029 domain-containing protein [Limibaculum sp. FT325]|uniref:glycosyltransferase family 87 protein n=1 Tax=Thermohalobaculum sediminis TaxID=2939436 RepID=UPI0020C0761D|nr:glycosyltransferase family 87 protein [Limibaculum sediminis]MCL5776582.1 DUF2029 domain-containing protein [Limibaculum sediminis]